MPKLPTIPRFVTTALMFGVLCLMLWMNSPALFVNTPPYDELDSCLISNIERQKSVNKEFSDFVADTNRAFYYPEIGIKSHFVHDQTIATLDTLQWIYQSLSKNGMTPENLTDSISSVLLNLRTNILQQVRKDMHKYFIPEAMLKEHQIDAAFVNFHKLSSRNKATILLALQLHITYTEWVTLMQFLRESSGCILSFNPYEAIAVPDKSWVASGEKNSATILNAMYNKAIDPSIVAYTGHIKQIEHGVGVWNGIVTNTLGIQTVSGTASITYYFNKNPDTITRPWSFEYLVVAPGASISLDKMHALYPNIPTTVTLSAPGYEAAKLKLRVPGATVEQTGDGQFKITANTKTKKLWAYLDAENEEGNITTLEGMELKIVPPPLPDISMNGHLESVLPITALQSHLQIAATPVYHDDSTGYTIHSFEYSLLQYDKKTATEPVHVEGAALPQITGATSGDKLIITDIHYSDEYGNTYEPQTISYYLLNRL